MRKPYATLVCLLLSAALWAQPDSANLHYRQGKTEAKLEQLEERLKEQEKNLNEKLEKQHSELAERLEVKNENLQFKMTLVGWLIAIFGIAVPILITIIGFFVGRKMYKDISKDQKEFDEKVQGYFERFEESEKKAQEHIERLDELEKIAQEHSKKTEDCATAAASRLAELYALPNEPATEQERKENIEKAQEIREDKNSSLLEKDLAEALELYFSMKHPEAIEKFETILTHYNDELTKPQLEDIYFRMAYSQNELGEKEKALELYNVTLVLNSNNSEAWNNKGNLLSDMGEEHYPDALACYNKAIELNPKYSEAWYNKGILLSDMGKEHYPEALACYNKAIELNNNYSEAWNNKGNLLKKMGGEHYPEALACYDKAIKLKPDYVNAHFNKGLLLEKMGKSDEEVLACYKEALRLNPNLEQARINIKRIEDKMAGK